MHTKFRVPGKNPVVQLYGGAGGVLVQCNCVEYLADCPLSRCQDTTSRNGEDNSFSLQDSLRSNSHRCRSQERLKDVGQNPQDDTTKVMLLILFPVTSGNTEVICAGAYGLNTKKIVKPRLNDEENRDAPPGGGGIPLYCKAVFFRWERWGGFVACKFPRFPKSFKHFLPTGIVLQPLQIASLRSGKIFSMPFFQKLTFEWR